MPAVVIASSADPVAAAASVWIDDELAARTVFEHLVGLGHRRVAYVSGLAEPLHTQARIAVLQSLVDGRALYASTDFSAAESKRATRALLEQDETPTAIVYDNEVMAIAGLRAIQRRGLRVPDDVSVASFDDSVILEHIHPSITSLTRDTVELGARVAEQLLAQIDAPTVQLAARPGPMPVLTARESTAPPVA